MISESTINEIRDRANLLEVIGEQVSLKRQGSGYVGLCPFHAEKSPSFHVRDSDKFYHCFGCGASGNVISFVMQSKGLAFVDAVEELAARFGITIKREGGSRSSAKESPKQLKDGLWKLNRIATEFFSQQLARADSKVKDYVAGRGLTTESIERFGIGFAPASHSALTEYLRGKRVPEELLLQSGLVRRSQRGDLYDVFRARVIFPVWLDPRRVAGFGGRLVPDLVNEETRAAAPKYLNSPETANYQKNKILYGIPQALESIRRSGEIYLVEGYMDVVGLAQAGVNNVVATCGTALSDRHVKRMLHLAKRVHVLFDGDTAGRSAAARSWKVFLNSGIDVAAVFLPEDQDPDDFAKANGERTAEALAQCPRRTLFECYLESLLLKFGATSARDLGAALKGRICEELSQSLMDVKNSIERSDLIQHAATKLQVSPDDLTQMIAGNSRPAPRVTAPREEESEVTEAAPAESALQPLNIPIEKLPRVDRELLHVIMARKEEYCAAALRDHDICEGIAPSTRAFIEGLDQILRVPGSSPDDTKERIKQHLKQFGASWLAHWKRSYAMLSDEAVKFDQLFEECRRSIRKDKLIQLVASIDQRCADQQSDEQRLALQQERLTLTRRLHEIGGNTAR